MILVFKCEIINFLNSKVIIISSILSPSSLAPTVKGATSNQTYIEKVALKTTFTDYKLIVCEII